MKNAVLTGARRDHGAPGVGGMGEVYRARDTHVGRDVAVKLLSSVLTGDPDLRACQTDELIIPRARVTVQNVSGATLLFGSGP